MFLNESFWEIIGVKHIWKVNTKTIGTLKCSKWLLVDMPVVMPHVCAAIYHPMAKPSRHEYKKKKTQILSELEIHCLLLLKTMPTQIQQQQLWWQKKQRASQNKTSANFWAKQEEIDKADWIKGGKKALQISILFAFIIFTLKQMETNLSLCKAKLVMLLLSQLWWAN